MGLAGCLFHSVIYDVEIASTMSRLRWAPYGSCADSPIVGGDDSGRQRDKQVTKDDDASSATWMAEVDGFEIGNAIPRSRAY